MGLGKILAALASIFHRIHNALREILATGEKILATLPPKIFGGKKKVLLYASAVAAIFLVMIIIAAAAASGRAPAPARTTPAATAAAIETPIPSEELFLPPQPEILPPFILEREPKDAWTAADISPHWQPVEASAYWRAIVRTAVDDLLETVP